MYNVQIDLPLDVIAAINDQIAATPGLMNTAYNRATLRLRQRWLADLRVEPPPAAGFYPIHWASARQRRAFFATDGFGGGIPHIRTHDLVKGWTVSINSAEGGGEIDVFNQTDVSEYVYGDMRQPMFMGASGGIPWLDPDVLNAQYLEEAESVLIDTWIVVTDIHAGVN